MAVERVGYLLDAAVGGEVVAEDFRAVTVCLFIVIENGLQSAADVVCQNAAVADREQDLIDTEVIKGQYALVAGKGDQGTCTGVKEGTRQIGQCGGGASNADGNRNICKMFREKISQCVRDRIHAVQLLLWQYQQAVAVGAAQMMLDGHMSHMTADMAAYGSFSGKGCSRGGGGLRRMDIDKAIRLVYGKTVFLQLRQKDRGILSFVDQLQQRLIDLFSMLAV